MDRILCHPGTTDFIPTIPFANRSTIANSFANRRRFRKNVFQKLRSSGTLDRDANELVIGGDIERGAVGIERAIAHTSAGDKAA